MGLLIIFSNKTTMPVGFSSLLSSSMVTELLQLIEKADYVCREIASLCEIKTNILNSLTFSLKEHLSLEERSWYLFHKMEMMESHLEDNFGFAKYHLTASLSYTNIKKWMPAVMFLRTLANLLHSVIFQVGFSELMD